MIYLSLKHSITNKFYVEIQLILHALENYNPPPLSLPITAFLAQKCCRSFLWAHTIWYTLKKRIEIKLICNYFCFQIMHDNREIGSYHPTTIGWVNVVELCACQRSFKFLVTSLYKNMVIVKCKRMFYQCCKIISTFVRRICFKFDFGKLRIFFLQKITKSCLKPLS